MPPHFKSYHLLTFALFLSLELLSACGRDQKKDGLIHEGGQVSAQQAQAPDESQAFLSTYHGRFVQRETGETLQLNPDNKTIYWVRSFSESCKLASSGKLMWVRKRQESDRQKLLSRATHVLLFEESALQTVDHSSTDPIECEKLRKKIRPDWIETEWNPIYLELTPNPGLFIVPSGIGSTEGSGQYEPE